MGVSLQDMLDARERRVALRHAFFSGSDPPQTLLQITVNIPGPVKNSDMIRDIYEEAIRSVNDHLPGAEFLPESSGDLKTGPEGYCRLSLTGDEAKSKTSLLEDRCPLGRLWDMDVFTDPDHSVSRRDLGLESRRCYLCDSPAHECSRSRRHSLDRIGIHIENLYREYAGRIRR